MDADAWLEANTFYCARLKAKLTRKQCEINRGLPELKDDGERFNHEYRGVMRKPIACEGCDGSGEVKKVGSNKVSPREIKRTIEALEECDSMIAACKVLGLAYQALYFRCRNMPEINKVAARKKFCKALPGNEPEPSSIKGQFDKKTDLGKPPTFSNDKGNQEEAERSSISEKPAQEADPQGDLSKAANNISGESTKLDSHIDVKLSALSDENVKLPDKPTEEQAVEIKKKQLLNEKIKLDTLWLQALLCKFPSFDPQWSVDVQDKWFALFKKFITEIREIYPSNKVG